MAYESSWFDATLDDRASQFDLVPPPRVLSAEMVGERTIGKIGRPRTDNVAANIGAILGNLDGEPVIALIADGLGTRIDEIVGRGSPQVRQPSFNSNSGGRSNWSAGTQNSKLRVIFTPPSDHLTDDSNSERLIAAALNGVVLRPVPMAEPAPQVQMPAA